MTQRPSIPRPGLPSASLKRPGTWSAPPPPRERLATLVVDDEDIVGIAVAPIAKPAVRKASAPPPPPARASIRPAVPASIAPPSHVPPAPESYVAPKGHVPAVVIPPASPVPTLAPPAAPAPRTPVLSILRLSQTDPTDAIFDGIYGLSFARSSAEAASMCAETLAKALKARAVVIHTHDLASGELRAIGAHGDGDFDILGTAESCEDDLVASAVVVNGRPVTMRFDGSLPGIAPKRLRHVGAPRTVVATPAIAWGRCLAIVEVIDADERFAARVVDSASYVADHLAQFLSAHAA